MTPSGITESNVEDIALTQLAGLDWSVVHDLRNFRNYLHPHQQMISGFTPDEHTAKVCFQVLKAALASVAGKR